MKLQLALVAAIDEGAIKFEGNGEADGPKKGIKEGKSKPKHYGPPMIHCSQQAGEDDYYYFSYCLNLFLG